MVPEYRKNTLKNMIKKNIPNAITCINAIGGTVASIFAVNPFEISGGLFHYQWTWLFIAISMLADFFDGFAARLLHVKSEMGKELDSLCDMVSFGVAPSILMFGILTASDSAPWWAWGAVAIAVGAALRLAKFNIDTRQTTSFLGLPVPANAMFWIGYSAAIIGGIANLATVWCFIPILLIVVYLMNSEVPLLSLKVSSWNLKDNIAQVILIVGAATLICLFGVQGLMWFVIFYLLVSLVVSRGALKPQK